MSECQDSAQYQKNLGAFFEWLKKKPKEITNNRPAAGGS
jgi:hypothetical protein